MLVRVRRWCQNDPQGLNGECRLSKIKRIVWDGSQELYEIQMPGQDGSTYLESDTTTVILASVTNTIKVDPNPFFGRVAYTHGAALDHPLSVIRSGYGDLIDEQNIERPHRALPPFAIMPLWTSNGQADNGVFADGAVRKCETISGVTRCVYIQWPAFFYAYARQSIRRSAWHGSLVEDKQDGAGTFYRRNRQYDPATGRFTQEDPIGLAGGLNLYGFAAGDPASYSDPFGLCPYGQLKPDYKTDDCPPGDLGDAMRELDRHGAAMGKATIRRIADNHFTPELVDSQTVRFMCGEGVLACSGSGFIEISNTMKVGDIAGKLAHETMHLVLGDLPSDPATVRASHEIYGIRASILATQGMSRRILGSNQLYWNRRYARLSSAGFDDLIYGLYCRRFGC